MKKIQTTVDIPAIVKIAEGAAREAGAYLLQKLGAAKVEHRKSLRDDVLDADLQAEQLIVTRLRKELPHIGMLSEESGQEGEYDHYWIIDPLDGSANFQHGSPLFGIAIALVTQQTPHIGVIYLPTRDEMFLAIQGQGAYLNNTRITVSEVAMLNEAIIHVGDFTKEGNLEIINEGLEDFSKLAKHTQRVRMIGTAAADLAYVACGRADALINYATTPWDIEAGKLLLLEAGGTVSTIQRPAVKPLSIYSNKHLHHIVKRLLETV
ncbi:MAG TPA: inositol monophosphatase family protein [Ktedonosporobacter sp.]|jgi:myo-inositol-1(or 4)-monophosphatase|nr:inositol monophosphatase family protein [Ktedonosporobacter sp.]